MKETAVERLGKVQRDHKFEWTNQRNVKKSEHPWQKATLFAGQQKDKQKRTTI